MISEDVISLTSKLISFNTINPPGDEKEIALYVGKLLTENGFDVEYIPFEETRLHVIAERGCREGIPPVVFTGHFDTVPLGVKEWSADPFGGEVKGDRLYGRGSSDMKGGVAAMIVAAVQSFKKGTPPSGVRLVLTSGEELGCLGAIHLVSTCKKIGSAAGLIVGEPTSNIPAIGHKGGLYLSLKAEGKTAHSSMPHLGDNAIYKVAHAISKIEKFDFGVEEDPLLGFPTINVGEVAGGLNINSVPDRASFSIDSRTTTKVDHGKLLKKLSKELGGEIIIEKLVDLPAVSSDENSLFVQKVYRASGFLSMAEGRPHTLPYLTDGAILQPAYGGVPTIILGPGQPEAAHQTDEFCYTANLERAVEIYTNIILEKEFANYIENGG